MRQIILISIAAFAFTMHLLAQSRDSVQIDIPSLPKVLNDSLTLKKSKNLISPSSFTTKENNPLLEDLNNGTIIEYDFPKQKRTFFNSSYTRFVIPTALISYGLIARGNESLLNLDHSTNDEIKEHVSKPIPYDDYTQYASALAIYALDWAGIKAKHNFRDRTLIVATSYLIMGATVQTMKRSFGIERPDGSNFHSFPSGHTATTFVGAHILFKEYKDVSPWIGIGGYAVASATGAMRIFNKKHWISDVVTGAGIGILSAEVGYMLLPVWHNVLGIKARDKSLVIAPMVTSESVGLGFAYTF